MSEEKHDLEKTTDATPEVNYDPEFLKWKEKEKAKESIDKLIDKDPNFKDILDSEVDGKTFREEILEKPKILTDEDLFEAKTKIYSKAIMEKIKQSDSTKQTEQKQPQDDSAERPDRKAPIAPDGKYAPAAMSVAELREKGYSEADIAMIKSFG